MPTHTVPSLRSTGSSNPDTSPELAFPSPELVFLSAEPRFPASGANEAGAKAAGPIVM
jgi:hypothetical protein